MTMTPAEKLAKEKQRSRPRRNPKAKSETIIWQCKLEEAREEVNLSMKDVAQAVGLSVSSYFRIEKGYSDVCLSNAMSIANFFGKSIYGLWPLWLGDDAKALKKDLLK